MATKINSLRQTLPLNGLLFTSELEKLGVSRFELRGYVNREWLVRLATGVYRFADASPDFYSMISSYQFAQNFDVVVGASTALELQGFSHYVNMGKPQAFVFTQRYKKLPKWIADYADNLDVREFSRTAFGDIGIETIEYNGMKLKVSSPERAIMECLMLAPKHFALIDVMYLMEMLTSLRPALVEQLMKASGSAKVNRLFMYMAEKARHTWLRKVDTTGVDFGAGTRSFGKGGVKDAKYNIVIPKELADYE